MQWIPILLVLLFYMFRSILLLVANGSTQLHKMYQSRCTAKNSWWWAERLPETCRVIIPIKLEFSASVGFIHKEASKPLVWEMRGFVPYFARKIVSSIRSDLIWNCFYSETLIKILCHLLKYCHFVTVQHNNASRKKAYNLFILFFLYCHICSSVRVCNNDFVLNGVRAWRSFPVTGNHYTIYFLFEGLLRFQGLQGFRGGRRLPRYALVP